MEARNRTLPDWMTKVRTRQIMLPRFQRMEAWGNKEITDLLNAILRGWPVGSVLTLEVGDVIPFVSRPLEGAPKEGERVTELLLDGQQRLTAIWRALHDNYPDRTYFVELDPGSDPPASVVSVARWNKEGTRYPAWADRPRACWERRYIPLRLLRPGEEGGAETDAWTEQAAEGDPKADKALSKEIARLRTGFAVFNLPFLSLEVGTPKEAALEVFIKMNTRMVQLTTFDILVAQMEEAIGESLHDRVSSLTKAVPDLTAYDDPEDIILNVMALLQDRVPSQAGYAGLDFPRIVEEWPLLVSSAQRAVEFLTQEGVLDATRLPTESVLAPIVALWAHVGEHPDQIGNGRILLRKYMWRAFFTDRYERAAATAALQDYRALRGVLKEGKPESGVPCFDEEAHPLPTVEALVQASWPKYRDRLARAVLLLSLRGGAHDIADDTAVTRASLRGREYHHLFPDAYLQGKGRESSETSRALNCALISWKTNRTISAKEPLVYLKERADASRLGDGEIRRRLATHAVKFDWLAGGDYDQFLRERAELASAAMRDLADGKAWMPGQ